MKADLEALVIGGVMDDHAAYWRIADLVDDGDFTQLRELWSAVATLARANKPADCLTIAELHPDLAKVAATTQRASTGAANVRSYAEILSKRSVERRVRLAGDRIAKLGGDDVLGEAQRIIGACAPKLATNMQRIGKHATTSFRGVIARYESDEPYSGVQSGLEPLDNYTAGFQRGDLIIVAARPSVGKTALAIQCALHASASAPVLFLSMEMTGPQLADRCIAHVGRINLGHVRAPKMMHEEEWPRLSPAKADLDTRALIVDESPALTLDGVCARVRQANADGRLALVVVDYLTCMRFPKAERMDQAVQEVTRGLKQLAKELQVPVMLLSQLNRAGADKPTLTSLRESGAIEQDADVVLILHRPDETKRHLVELIIAKQRQGECGIVWTHFDGAYQCFSPTDERPSADSPDEFTSRRRRGGNPNADRAAS